MLESALCAGIAAAGGQALLAGVLPTPAASVLVRGSGSTSRPSSRRRTTRTSDNGIKFFDARVASSRRSRSLAIEQQVGVTAPAVGTVACARLAARSTTTCASSELAVPLDLEGVRVLLDCANGATYRAAPLIFERLGADVDAIASEPDGTNINAGCGSTHLEPLVERMKAGSHDVGFAFDGDGDRVLAVDRDGSGRRRRRDHRSRRASPERTWTSSPAGRGGDGDDELRLSPGDGGGGHRGRDDEGR